MHGMKEKCNAMQCNTMLQLLQHTPVVVFSSPVSVLSWCMRSAMESYMPVSKEDTLEVDLKTGWL